MPPADPAPSPRRRWRVALWVTGAGLVVAGVALYTWGWPVQFMGYTVQGDASGPLTGPQQSFMLGSLAVTIGPDLVVMVIGALALVANVLWAAIEEGRRS